MKAAIYAGALTATLFGAAAWAQGTQECPPGYKPSTSSTASSSSSTGTGGSGTSADATQQQGAETTATQNEVSVTEEGARAEAQTHQEQQGTGGSGSVDGHCVPDTAASSSTTTTSGVRQEETGVGGAGLQSHPANQGAPAPSAATQVNPQPFENPEQKTSKADMRGLTLLVGGGVEGYTKDLAPVISPGVAWGVTAAIKPSRVIGIELGYNGAANEVKGGLGVDLTDGDVTDSVDVVRNGGQAVATVGLATPLQPYLLAGIGISHYNVKGESLNGRLKDDTNGSVPTGAGLRWHLGHFTADARVTYNFLFDQEFASRTGNADINAPGDTTLDSVGRYMGSLNVGGTF